MLAKSRLRQTHVDFHEPVPRCRGTFRLEKILFCFKESKKWLTKLRSDKNVNQQELDLFEKAIDDEKLDDDFRRMVEPPKLVKNAGNSAELSQRGWKLFFKGQSRPAELAFREALDADPKNDAASNGLGFALLNQANERGPTPV